MKRGGNVSGAVSLVMIFCVLCLAVFAVLTLATADRERNLAELTARSAENYYAADRQAVEIAAALLEGGTPETDIEIEHTFFNYPGGSAEAASFTVPVSDEQGLEVELLLRDLDGSFKVLRWQTMYTGGWETDDTLELWSGDIY